ncbi:UNVERIFIED_CONTAM: hypothetical protein PYX00_010059 [Menopon gallinae]|uniref:Fibronectin type-III domain-containing protein n=1 Tax=Menopon gallinae TaxID=328185 RepID=A0AAW2HE46_9NEOP
MDILEMIVLATWTYVKCTDIRPELMTKWILISSVVICTVVQVTAFECAGVSYPFGILPKEDHYVKYGDSLELYCMLDMSHNLAIGYTSRNLSFFISEYDGRVLLNHTIVNETTIRTVVDSHYLENLPKRTCYIFCSLKLNATQEEKNCATYVTVGLAPQEVTNFSCISYNWEKLECKWYPPETHIETEYNVMVAVIKGNQPNASEGKLDYYECPKVPNTTNMCEITRNTPTPYRQPYGYYHFKLIGRNRLGTHVTSKSFNHFANVKPNKAQKFSVVNATSESVLVTWSIPFPMNIFRPGLYTKIEYRSQWDPPDEWITEPIIKTEENTKGPLFYNIKGLKYPYTTYEVRIFLKSGASETGNLWSEPDTLTFKTLPAIPATAPKTTFGSYEVNSRHDGIYVTVYWKRLPESLQNGEGLHYNVTCLMNNKYDCGPPSRITLTYADYPVSKNNEYRFTIYSINNVGRSIDSSTVFVPKLGSIPRPESFTDVRYANGVRELSWKPFENPNLSNYTIFWCEQDESLRLPCNGTIDWVHVDKNVTVKNITMKSVNKFYDVGIAANLNDGSSSGMVWFSCIVSHDIVSAEVISFTIGNVASREATILWDMKCVPSQNGGYYLYYCPVLSMNNPTCIEKEMEMAVKGFGMKNGTLTKLKPYTLYCVQISVYYNDTQVKIGPRNEMKCFRTKEEAPSEPLNLREEIVTNSTITLMWHPPRLQNGILTGYKLHVVPSTSSFPIEINNATMFYELTDLSSFTLYNLTLEACNGGGCSNATSINVTTRPGVPGSMPRPHIAMNNSVVVVTWEKPRVAAGDLNYYELSVISDTNKKILNFTGTWGEIPSADCGATFRIRAVNVDGDKVYQGRWSKATVGVCDAPDLPLLMWSAGILLLFAVTGVLFYIVKRGWLHCRKMKDVEVKLPPGLQSQDLEKDNQDYLHLDPWPPRPNDTIQGTIGPGLAPDEESLLGKKSDECLDPYNIGVKNGGDSSGCSMGRESMSSSVASDNHGSSDSGAEADQCTNTMRVPFGEWDSMKTQPTNAVDDPTKGRRHIRKGSNPEDFPTGDWNTDDPTVPGYTRVGFTDGSTSDKSLPGKGYVAIASIPTLNAMSGLPPLNPPQKSVSENSYNSLPMDNFPLLFDQETRTPATPETKGLSNPQTNAPPCYVALACLQEHRLDGSTAAGGALNSSRPLVKDSEKCQNDVKDGAPAEALPYNSSTNEAEETPLPRSNGPMPPYVSMIEKPTHTTSTEEEDEEDDEEEEEEEEEKYEETRLSPDLGVSSKKTVRGIDSALVDRISKDTESYPNYIPHHVFGKESLHTQ